MQNNILEHNKKVFLRTIKQNINLFNNLYSLYYNNEYNFKLYCDAFFKSYFPFPIIDRICNTTLFREYDKYGEIRHTLRTKIRGLYELVLNDSNYINQRFTISLKNERNLLIFFCKKYGIIPEFSSTTLEKFVKIGRCYYINRDLELCEEFSLKNDITLSLFIINFLDKLNEIFNVEISSFKKIKRNLKLLFFKKLDN